MANYHDRNTTCDVCGFKAKFLIRITAKPKMGSINDEKAVCRNCLDTMPM